MPDPENHKTPARRGPGRPVGSNRERSLDRIHGAARQLFATQGYSKTTFKEIAAAAGMTHAALYGYYPSKAALFQAACEQAQQVLLDAYAPVLAQDMPVREQLAELLRIIARSHDEDPAITGLLASIPLEIRRHPELAELLLDRQNATLKVFSEAFERARERGEINDSARPHEVVSTILGAAMGIGLFQYGLPGSALGNSMEVFIALIEGRLFKKARVTVPAALGRDEG